jgi:DNA-binding beta-propeller fold protein YncE
MRYIKIGLLPGSTEAPHCLRTSADGMHAYVSFLNGTGIQKIDTRTDQVTSTANIGTGSWNIVFVAPNDTMLVTTDWTSNGRILYARTSTMTTVPGLTGSGSGLFVYPHGLASNAAFDTCFVTAQYGNVVYRWAPEVPSYRVVSIDAKPPVATGSNDKTSPNPHEILMAPDYSKYFLSCEGTNEVRVLDAHSDAILKAIPVGAFPQELAISHSMPYLFVTCMEDAGGTVLAGRRGSVYVINYNTYEIVKVITGDFYQPHGVAVDDRNGRIYIASTNANPDGPAPHHATACNGRAGWYSVYNLSTLEPVNSRRYQVTVMPYSADVRFKTP